MQEVLQETVEFTPAGTIAVDGATEPVWRLGDSLMSDIFDSAWFYWAIGIAVGLPLSLVLLTEWQHTLQRRKSFLLRPVTILRNYLLPLGALLLLMLEANQIPPEATSVRVVSTLVAFVVLVLMLSGIKAALFQSARTAPGASGFRRSSSTCCASFSSRWVWR